MRAWDLYPDKHVHLTKELWNKLCVLNDCEYKIYTGAHFKIIMIMIIKHAFYKYRIRPFYRICSYKCTPRSFPGNLAQAHTVVPVSDPRDSKKIQPKTYLYCFKRNPRITDLNSNKWSLSNECAMLKTMWTIDGCYKFTILFSTKSTMVEGIKAKSRVEVGTLAKMAQYQNGLGKQHTVR